MLVSTFTSVNRNPSECWVCVNCSLVLSLMVDAFLILLAGLVAELAYVRDGSINDVAQHFVVPVPAHIHELCFVWVNADPKSVSRKSTVTICSSD